MVLATGQGILTFLVAKDLKPTMLACFPDGLWYTIRRIEAEFRTVTLEGEPKSWVVVNGTRVGPIGRSGRGRLHKAQMTVSKTEWVPTLVLW